MTFSYETGAAMYVDQQQQSLYQWQQIQSAKRDVSTNQLENGHTTYNRTADISAFVALLMAVLNRYMLFDLNKCVLVVMLQYGKSMFLTRTRSIYLHYAVCGGVALPFISVKTHLHATVDNEIFEGCAVIILTDKTLSRVHAEIIVSATSPYNASQDSSNIPSPEIRLKYVRGATVVPVSQTCGSIQKEDTSSQRVFLLVPGEGETKSVGTDFDKLHYIKQIPRLTEYKAIIVVFSEEFNASAYKFPMSPVSSSRIEETVDVAGALPKRSWNIWESDMEEHVKELINIVDDIPRAVAHTSQCSHFLNQAISELVNSLKLSSSILTDLSKDVDIGTVSEYAGEQV